MSGTFDMFVRRGFSEQRGRLGRDGLVGKIRSQRRLEGGAIGMSQL